jgi:hypothetical protein
MFLVFCAFCKTVLRCVYPYRLRLTPAYTISWTTWPSSTSKLPSNSRWKLVERVGRRGPADFRQGATSSDTFAFIQISPLLEYYTHCLPRYVLFTHLTAFNLAALSLNEACEWNGCWSSWLIVTVRMLPWNDRYENCKTAWCSLRYSEKWWRLSFDDLQAFVQCAQVVIFLTWMTQFLFMRLFIYS